MSELIAESTSDTPEQIAEALGVTLDPPLTPQQQLDAAKATLKAAEDAAAKATADAEAADDEGADEEPETLTAADADAGDATVIESETTLEVIGSEHSTDASEKLGVPKPKPTRSQRRLEAEGAKAVLESENAALRKRVEELTAGATPGVTKPAAVAAVVEQPKVEPVAVVLPVEQELRFKAEREKLGAKPKQEDFADFSEYEDKKDAYLLALSTINAREQLALDQAAKDTKAKEAQATEQFTLAQKTLEARKATARARHADFDAVTTQTDVPVNHAMEMMLLDTDPSNDLAGELLYYLGTHKDECAQIAALPFTRTLIRMGELKAKVAASLAAGPPKPKTVVSRAPTPTTSVGSGDSARPVDPASETVPYSDWKTKANERERRRLGRR